MQKFITGVLWSNGRVASYYDLGTVINIVLLEKIYF